MYSNLKIIDPNIDDLFNTLDADHKKLSYYLIEGCKIANLIYSDQIHPNAREIIKLFVHVYKNYPKYDSLYDPDILLKLKKYTEFLLSTHSNYNIHFKKEIPPIDRDTLSKLVQLTRYPTTIDKLLDSIYDADIDLIVDGSIQKSKVGHYRGNFGKNDVYDITKVSLNNRVDKVDTIVIRSYSMKDLNSNDMKLAHSWFKKALDICSESKTISPTIKTSLTKLLIFLQEGSVDSLDEYHKSWVKIEGVLDFLFSPFEVYMDPMHRMGSYASEVTIESVNLTNFKKIWIKLENSLPIPDEYKSKSIAGNMSFRTKIYSGGANGPIRMISAYCLPNSSADTKQVIYTYSTNNGIYLNKHIERMIDGDMSRFCVNVAYTTHLILHEWAHATGKFTKHLDGTPITSTNLPEYISKDFSSLEELRAETFAVWTLLNNYKDLLECFPELKKADKLMGDRFKELYTTMIMDDGIRRLAGCDGNPIEAHARANMVLTNYVMSYDGLEILEESVHGLFNIGCKVDMNKIVDIIKKLCIQVQSIKSTGNGSGNDKLFNWFVKNPIGDAKMKQYAIKLKHKNSMLMSGIEVENYPKLQIVDKMVVLKHIDFIEGCNYL